MVITCALHAQGRRFEPGRKHCVFCDNYLSRPQTLDGEKNIGDGGYRSPYLSHAKRALYHLSYVPYYWTVVEQYQTSKGRWFKSMCPLISFISSAKQIVITKKTQCFLPGSNRRPCACKAPVMTTTLRKLHT